MGTASMNPCAGRNAGHVRWIDADDGRVAFGTEAHRASYGALAANPRTTITGRPVDDSYGYAPMRGRVAETVAGPAARHRIDPLAQWSTGTSTRRGVGTGTCTANAITSERVAAMIVPERRRHRIP